ncbi:MAG: glucosaminidase domain-containing protein [Paludibacteraceae bacterium]|nr:glucosaminidase domain-containing protein [Prevotella sp.]MBQ8705956.1 glucosaminidase domain-containing protein [Paludibacteraceae bacterium]MBQ8715171.1 glucosaminidase domain-containing protein [Prevotella sp.]
MKKIILAGLLVCMSSVPMMAQMKWSQQYQQYFDQYKDYAIEQMRRYHIPASITLAQGVLESAAGKSELTVKGNNHFGIKCHGWTGRAVYHDDDERNECFRAYDNAYDSYEDHSKFLSTSNRYSSLFKLKLNDYKGWAYGLKACGYATNPRYAIQLIDIIQLYKLYEYDDRKSSKSKSSAYQMGEYRVYEFNKNYYVIAKAGDSYRKIGDIYDVSYKKLAKYNENDRNAVLEEGDFVWLQKKRRHAPKEYKKRPHVVKDGESMYTIAQRYGIRLKYLYKMNDLTPDYQIKVGDVLRIR